MSKLSKALQLVLSWWIWGKTWGNSNAVWKMNLLIRAPPWQMTYLEANYLWGPGGRGINLIKVWKHNKTKGSASISWCPIRTPRMPLMCWRSLPLRAATYSYPSCMAPTAADLAEAKYPPHILLLSSPQVCLWDQFISATEGIMTASITRAFQWTLIKPSTDGLPLSLMTWFIRSREIT